MREKLIETLSSTKYGKDNASLVGDNFQIGFLEKIADHLIASGVTLRQSKPCMLCESDKIHIQTITKEPEQLFSFSTEETGLMFCPMCGRDLRGVK